MLFPTRDIFIELSKQGNLIPVYKEWVADLETPISAYLKLDTGKHTFLLESVEKGERTGRYSFVGTDPRVIFTARGRNIRDMDQGGEVSIPAGDVSEPVFRQGSEGGVRDYVLPGNKEYVEGDTIAAPLIRLGTMLAAVHGGQQGLNMVQNAHFVALEGTRTFACQFRNVFVPDAEVLAHPNEFEAFIKRIKPGFVTMQCGIALGLIDDCVAIMRQSDQTHAHVNQYLDDQADDLAGELNVARAAIYDLAARISAHAPVTAKEILGLRAAGSELSLKASTAAMLHSGAKGYMIRNPAQRRVLPTVRFSHPAQQVVLQDYIDAVSDSEARIERLTEQIAGLMSGWSLAQYIRHLADNRQATERYEIALWKKVVYPFAALVMMALALPFAYLHVRFGGVGIKVFAGIMLGILFHFLNSLFSTLGVLQSWPPLASALLPSVMFLLMAVEMMWWVERR